ncbi:MAG: preprotein translocase subunit SecA [Negativicutes bacterium]|jgi:preprotein translocase subunit SecA
MSIIGWIKNLFGDYSESEINRMKQYYLDVINDFEPILENYTDGQLAEKTTEFMARYHDGEVLETILPEAFAVVREASKRTLGMRHFDVQLIGGITLHEGRIAEMRTGEGKTLVATLPAYLNAITGKGVHVVTVNDYLAKRDSEWMGQIYKFLGLSVGLIVRDMDFEHRRIAYNSDITYGTNNEFGFDYLRDNMVVDKEQMVQRPLNFAIIDEVDSILIDEARTPLIISGPAEKSADLYVVVSKIIPKLRVEEDYTIDEKAQQVALTEQGIGRVEKLLAIDNLYDGDNMQLAHHVNQALKAHALMHRDKEYVVKDDEVIIVDEFTGRLMFGRRYSDGLHQSIEAKEGVKIQRENQTLASTTFQNYFRIYNKLSGMTGTAKTEEQEFRKIYGLDVIVIPTHRDMIREDFPDVIFKNQKAKYKAVINEICELHAIGRPVLVGTTSIVQSEQLSEMLKRRGIVHNVLNAKYHEQEANIIANAGQYGAVTIATNMAGRGTDIVLGVGVADLGGLHILGTERHESRRIDNQLRGRSGRQGDGGSSRFYLSLEDDLMRLFGENVAFVMDKLGMDEDMPIESSLVSKTIERAQKKLEAHNFSIRKYVLEYDDVMNQQRLVIYDQRRKILEEDNLKNNIFEMLFKVAERGVQQHIPDKTHAEDWDIEGLITFVDEYMPIAAQLRAAGLTDLHREELAERIHKIALDAYAQKESSVGSENMRILERAVALRIVDNKWLDHLNDMDALRQGVGLRAYGQKDPLMEYKFEAFDLFQQMIENIQEDICRFIYRVDFVKPPEDHLKEATAKHGNEQIKAEKRTLRSERETGRNEFCPCGSGKKYKKCCGAEK